MPEQKEHLNIEQTVQNIQTLYQAHRAEGTPRAEAEVLAFAEGLALPVSAEDLRAASGFEEGSYIGDRSSTFELSVMIIGLFYGRKAPNLLYQYDRELVGRLHEKYVNAWGTCYSDETEREQADATFPEKARFLLEVLESAKAEGMLPWSREKEALQDKFHVNEKAKAYSDLILDELDYRAIAAADETNRVVDVSDWDPADVRREYVRGVLNKIEVDGELLYYLGVFDRRLDCFVRGERDAWYALPEAAKEVFKYINRDYDIWVFPDLAENKWPKSQVFPVEYVLDLIDRTENTLYLQECDCRIYMGAPCGKPVDVCLHWPDSTLNTPFDRGFAHEVTKEEAKAHLLRADKAGCIHTMNPGKGNCNCCTDCCWGFSQLGRLEGTPYSPKKHMYDVFFEVQVDEEACVNCGLCAKQCPFGVLSRGEDGHIVADVEKCYGCGVCRAVCPKDALSMRSLERPDFEELLNQSY